MSVTDDRQDHLTETVGRISHKYWLWLIIPLAISIPTAFWNRSAALGFGVFVLSLWAFVGIVALILRGTKILMGRHVSPERHEEIQQSIGMTLFLGGCALAGMVIRGENGVSQFIEQNKPDGVSVSFVDPTFALVCIVLVWAYTIYRLRK